MDAALSSPPTHDTSLRQVMACIALMACGRSGDVKPSEAAIGYPKPAKEPMKNPAKIYLEPRLSLEQIADPLHLGFTDYEQIHAKMRTRRQRFLEEMEITVPWEAFLALIKPVYHKPSSKGVVRRFLWR